MTVGKPELLAGINQRLILDDLRKLGPRSRADLSRDLGLSFPSVSSNVETLLAQGFITVQEADTREEGASGRKPIRYAYNASWGYVVAVDLGRSHIRMMVCDMTGRPLNTSEFALRNVSEDALPKKIDNLFERLLADAQVELEKVRCVNVAMPGILNTETQQLEAAPFLNRAIRQQRVDKHLEAKYGVRTCAGNAVNCAAIAEKWQGAGIHYSDIVYVDCSVGVGSAIILNGELVTGFNGAAGEIGYMLPGLPFRRAAYEEVGVLEKILASAEIERRMNLISNGSASVRDLFSDEDFWAPCLEDIRNYLALALVNITAMINPEIIIVGGRFGQVLMSHYADYFREVLKAHVPFTPKLAKAALDDRAVLLGGAGYALRLVRDEQTLPKL